MRTYWLLIVAAGLWCCLILATPMLAAGSDVFRVTGHVLLIMFSPVCHQWDSHSFHIFGEKLPVCIRCSAIYFGFFFGLLLYPSIGKRVERRFTAPTIWIAAIAGMILDVTASMAGLSNSTTVSRILTGGTFGILGAFVLMPLFHELIDALRTETEKKNNDWNV